MTILTAAEAANFLRTHADDAVMLQLMPLVDEYLKNASGHDWTTDSTKHPTAKLAAGMLLSFWYDQPLMVGQTPAPLSAALVQLEAEALKYRKVEFAGLSGAGGIALAGARKGDKVVRVVGTYGVSGSQAASFESVVSVDGQLQQTDGADLSGNLYAAALHHPADDVSA